MGKVARITIDDNRFLFIESHPDNLKNIKKEFTFPDFSECWERGKFHKEKIKQISFLTIGENNISGLLPIGFRGDLEKWLDKNDFVYKTVDKRINETYNFTEKEIAENLGYLTLDSDQIQAVKTCLEQGNGLVSAATGAGKTEIFISLCNLTKKKTLVLFSSIQLAKQTLVRMKNAGLDSGIVQGGNVDENHQVVMATVQSSHKLYRNDYEMVIIDETHKATGEQYQDVLKRMNCRYRFGFSATPFTKKDHLRDARTKAFLGDVIYKLGAATLIEKKRLADPTIHIVTINKPFGFEDAKWIVAERRGIIYNKYRNQKIADIANSVNGSCLILLKNIAHGEELCKLIPDAIFLHGSVEVKEREKITARFEAGEKFTLIASTIFDEGIDIKSVMNVIIAGGGQSPIKAVQRVGRGLRTTATKKTVEIYDFYDQTNVILEKHSIERIHLYEEEGFKKIVYEKVK